VVVTMLVSVVSSLLGATVVIAYRYRRKWLAAHERLKANLDMDLDLATTEQLMDQLRKRPNDCIILSPVYTEDDATFGINVEVHGLDPVQACRVLKMSSILAMRELERQGIEVPPDLSGEDE
jgi:hypothetical protein